MAESDDGMPHDRRAFFREAFTRFVQPVAEYLDTQIGTHLPAGKVLLRPPGALPGSGVFGNLFAVWKLCR